MSVADQINRIKTNIANTYTAAQSKGATMPQAQNSDNLASCVQSITTGGGGGGTQFGLTAEQMLGTLDSSGTLTFPTLPQPDFSGIVTLSNNGFYYKFTNRGFAENTVITFPVLTSIDTHGIENAFANCTGITSVSFPVLTSVDSQGMYSAFQYCTGITSVSFPALASIDTRGMAFAFRYCTGITSVSFPALASINSSGMSYTFQTCTKLESISFPALTQVTSPFNKYTFAGCTALTEIHFRADMQATIEAMTGYADKFGASGASIIFDL